MPEPPSHTTNDEVSTPLPSSSPEDMTSGYQDIADVVVTTDDVMTTADDNITILGKVYSDIAITDFLKCLACSLFSVQYSAARAIGMLFCIQHIV